MAGVTEKKTALEMVQADVADEGCVTFVLHDEDHTLGNSLRYMVMKNPDVEFCGYNITHPSESKINFRIQTQGLSLHDFHGSPRLPRPQRRSRFSPPDLSSDLPPCLSTWTPPTRT
ncbi:DNA-directed RNA polymerases I and III subunit RPAC2 isoform X1 [Lampris incognitus]|uniref:DNA-directed RNA polymerases I and III subunit RPAC2 isoform X1 n=1 Tax=Lampris incognitus TaxID=2546036 RepID=UPI0024B63002|nr:DNA-directed RNA polymerases I and III subunit RPAC2 isoform X1 [Lampris incognitus]